MASRALTVTTTATLVASFDQHRKTLLIRNNGVNPIFMSNDEANVSTAGLPLNQNDSLSLVKALGDEPELRWYAATTAGSSDVRVLEGFVYMLPSGL